MSKEICDKSCLYRDDPTSISCKDCGKIKTTTQETIQKLHSPTGQIQKVFIPNKGVHDYSDAERYGQIVFVTKGEQSKNAVGKMARRWADVLKNSSPNDYILVTSLTTLCSIGCSVFALKHKGFLNLLLFREGRYIARTLRLDQVLEGLDEESEN